MSLPKRLNPVLITLVIFLQFPPVNLSALERYDLLKALTAKGTLPRILNSDDIPDYRPTNPQPLFAPLGDFNGDGFDDVAISGIYGFPPLSKKYFLLVGTELKDPGKFVRLFYEEFDGPVFIHKTGTTGKFDPGDQAFSATFCSDCKDGVDFYWNKKRAEFIRVAWEEKEERLQKVFIEPGRQVPPEIVEKALHVVSKIFDVTAFVDDLKKEDKKLGTRVEYRKESGKTNQFNVIIFEKSEDQELIYDVITVDVKRMTVIKRKKGPPENSQ